ncbi:hypothetical protein BZ160_21675 [Pantoea vagans]|nr:hypothetical protein RN49_03475 [Pantoea agglomerans]OQV38272.1 hypothetical protein BZ160_21675 [Pantoea vagans]MBA5704930.1 hypothetical protein [Pantoea agglomerans]TKJ54526.1 hypothetical protein PagCFBP13505_18595 [Pantoea agglomerans]TKK15829.1 hypothetical protein PagCFBP13516_19220 [Pantoea agglomerans]
MMRTKMNEWLKFNIGRRALLSESFNGSDSFGKARQAQKNKPRPLWEDGAKCHTHQYQATFRP